MYQFLHILMQFVPALHVFICIFLVIIVLLQQGKGADMGATFGGGSQTLFGASGADTLLTRVTTVLALGFMGTSLVLALNAKHVRQSAGEGKLLGNLPVESSVEKDAAKKEAAESPAAPVAPASSSDSPEAAPASGTRAPSEAGNNDAPAPEGSLPAQ